MHIWAVFHRQITWYVDSRTALFKLIYVIVNNNTVEPMIKDYSEIMKKLSLKKKRSLKREREWFVRDRIICTESWTFSIQLYLCVPSVDQGNNGKHLGVIAVSMSAAGVWNSLPFPLREQGSKEALKRNPKTYLKSQKIGFVQAIHCWHFDWFPSAMSMLLHAVCKLSLPWLWRVKFNKCGLYRRLVSHCHYTNWHYLGRFCNELKKRKKIKTF